MFTQFLCSRCCQLAWRLSEWPPKFNCVNSNKSHRIQSKIALDEDTLGEGLLHFNIYFFFHIDYVRIGKHHSSDLIRSQLLHECNFNLLSPLPFISNLSRLSRICCVPLHYEFFCILVNRHGDVARPPSISFLLIPELDISHSVRLSSPVFRPTNDLF